VREKQARERETKRGIDREAERKRERKIYNEREWISACTGVYLRGGVGGCDRDQKRNEER
jgi:hypothetical protein